VTPFEALRRHGLAFPEAQEDFPWGHTALKVRGKTFAWLDRTEGKLSMTVKLPASRDFALVFDFAEPAGYGLGRSGWISCRFDAGEAPDLDLLKRWVAESYRAVAPKKLAALLPGEG
jgi:predicted DNA-binding protein (MmcQ/YjbR family)